MREIKFRAWHLDAEQMVEWDKLKNLKYCIENDNIVLLQYTGLNDINGINLYEGDIVERNEPGCEGSYISKYEVIYKENSFCLKVLRSHVFINGAILYKINDCTIIGNIYSNPELLTR